MDLIKQFAANNVGNHRSKSVDVEDDIYQDVVAMLELLSELILHAADVEGSLIHAKLLISMI